MSAINFPDAPSPGQVFSNWAWDGTKWVPALGVIDGKPFIGTAPPPNPVPGDLWWDDVGGQLYIYYNDGNSSQWVLANVSPIGPTGATGPQGPIGTGPFMGRVNGTEPLAGQVGEYVKVGSMQSANAVANTWTVLAPNLVLAPGDWQITGAFNVGFTSPTPGTVSPAINGYYGALFYNGTELADSRMAWQLDTFPATIPTQPFIQAQVALPVTRVNSSVQITMNYSFFWRGTASTVSSAIAGGWMAGRRMS